MTTGVNLSRASELILLVRLLDSPRVHIATVAHLAHFILFIFHRINNGAVSIQGKLLVAFGVNLKVVKSTFIPS